MPPMSAYDTAHLAHAHHSIRLALQKQANQEDASLLLGVSYHVTPAKSESVQSSTMLAS